jgi:hypothetical protein
LTFFGTIMLVVPLGLMVALIFLTVQSYLAAKEAFEWEDVLLAGGGLVILTLPYAMGLLLWAMLFAAVGWKYNIKEVQNSPCSFIWKACCCLCAMNVRVGLHVDRAQGFRKANKYVMQMVQMSEHVRVETERIERQSVKSRPSFVPIRHSISAEVLEDDNLRQVEGIARTEEHTRRLSQGRHSRTPLRV